MKITCIVPIGPVPHPYLSDALVSAKGLFDETILCVHVNYPHMVQLIAGKIDKDYRLVISTEGSCAFQMNLAIVNASGDYIVILDDDDLFDRLGQQAVRAIAELENNRDVYFGQVMEFDTPVTTKKYNIWPINPDLTKIHTTNQVPVCAMFRKQMWFKLGGFRHIRYDDWDFWKRAVDNGYTFKFIDVITYHHRRWSGSAGVLANQNYRSDLPLELPLPY
jgi:glycosyltransferase involved in cell wall biosynthesis